MVYFVNDFCERTAKVNLSFDSFKYYLLHQLVPDGVTAAQASGFHNVRLAAIISVPLGSPARHPPATIPTAEEAGKQINRFCLGGSPHILFQKLLRPVKGLLIYDGFVCIFYPKPIIFRDRNNRVNLIAFDLVASLYHVA